MDREVNVYDLNNSYYLYDDIEHTIDAIGTLFEINFFKSKIEFISKINYPEDAFWISDEVTETFNAQVPVIKGIIKDIYALIEGISVAKSGKFDKSGLEGKYPELKILREFNNKLKHHNNKHVTFNVVSIINIQSKTLDCIVQYNYDKASQIEIIPLHNFFEIFFLILEDEDIISIDRK
jgi:hypothetical protein